MQVQAYLFFDGRCEEAIEFYRKTLGAEVDMLMRFKENPEPQPGMSGPGFDDKVMHASFRIGETLVMASDGQCAGQQPRFQGFSLTLNPGTEAEADKLFAALADGGQVQMPMAKTFFSPRFGAVADRFGVSWMVIAQPPVAASTEEFVISRTFNAPRALVWKAWSEAERLAQWWGPKGCKIRVVKLEFRPGGTFHYAMQFKPGHEMWGRFIYREIAAPERIVFVNSFSDVKGGIMRAPFKDTWPLEVLNTVTFTEQGGKTTMTLRGAPIKATAEELEAFAGMFASMQQGFGGTFDQLAAYLARAG